MLSLLNPTTLLAALLALLGAFGAGFYKGSAEEKGKAAQALLVAVQKANDTEAKWKVNLEAQDELDQEERTRMAAAYDAGIQRLRQRVPERLPAASSEACAGASPAQLAAPDAERFERIGRDCRAVQLDLEKARAWIETVTGKP